MFGTNYFGAFDYFIVIASLVICLGVGVYYAYFSKHTNEELLVGGRNMSIFPVACSIMVSFFSAVTILGYPAEVYSFGIEIFCQTLFQGMGVVISAYLLVPFFYSMRLTSIYEYLELRYESLTMRRIGSFIFMLEQMSLAGLLLYAPSLALESFLGLPMWISVFGIGLCGTAYTSVGGLKAVVWTDSFQFVIMVIGLVGIIVKGFIEYGGVSEVFSVAYQNGRLKLFDFTVNPFMRHTFLNFLLGGGVVTAIRTSVHQVQVQRYMSLPNVTYASRALVLSVPLKVGVMGIMLLAGITLYAANAKCDPVLSNKISKLDQLVTMFVVEKLAIIPGSLGLFTACIFSAVLSSLSSMLNSLAAVTWEDYLSRTSFFGSMGPTAQTNVSRVLSFLFGVIAMCLAYVAQYVGPMFAASWAITGVSTGAICAIFTMGVFMPFINKIGAGIGTLVGLISVASISVLGFVYKPTSIKLPVSVENCTSDILESINSQSNTIIPSENLPGNINALSYILYPFVGIVIGISTGTIISLATGGFTKSQLRKIDPKYVHPWVRKLLPKRNVVNMERELECLSK